MPRRFVSRKTALLYEQANGGSFHLKLIFGDEVTVPTNAQPVNNRLPARFRSQDGFIRVDSLGGNAVLELYFIDVGQGDSTFIVTPRRRKILIDGGTQNRRALGFLIWKYRLDQPGNTLDIDLAVLSHADGDHIDGLTQVLSHPRIRVREVVHSGIGTFAGGFGTALGDLDPSGNFLVTRHNSMADLAGAQLSGGFDAWRNALLQEGSNCRAVDSSTGPLDVGDPAVRLNVLGPRLEENPASAVRWFHNKSQTINGHSVVLRLTYRDVSALFPGDLNVHGSDCLLVDPALASRMDAHILKCPHHGSHDFSPGFLEAVRPQVSVISSGDGPDHGHPRALFMGAVGLASRSTRPLLFSTEIAATFTDAGENPLAGPPQFDALNFATDAGNVMARRIFKQRLPGIINVRTDGRNIYSARRVQASYQWEACGPDLPAERPSVFGGNPPG